MKNRSEKRVFAIYSRKSRESEKGESIENQIEMCRARIIADYGPIPDDNIFVYEDEGFSGKNLARPQFQKMMKKINSEHVTALICYRVDRISRSIGDFSNFVSELKQRGTDFVSLNEKFDTVTPMGNAMMYLCAVFAQLERETITERIVDNMHELAKTGRWLGGMTPTGYRSEQFESRVTDVGKKKMAFRLVEIQEEKDLVLLIYDLFLKSNSLTNVESYLISHCIKTKNQKDFTRFTIREMLTNPVYMAADKDALAYFTKNGVEVFADEDEFDGTHGVMAYNKTKQNATKSHQKREMSEWIIAVGKHHPFISGADWVKVQDMLGLNASKSYRKPRSHQALLSGLLFCGKCGSYMRPKLGHKLNEQGERAYSYLCQLKEKSKMHNCNMINADGNMLDRLVLDKLKALSVDGSELMRLLEDAQKSVQVDHKDTNEQENHYRSLLRENRRKAANLLSILSTAEAADVQTTILGEIKNLDAEKKKLENTIKEIQAIEQLTDLTNEQFEIQREILASFGRSCDTMDIEQKRSFIRTFVKRVVWDGENAHIYLFFSEDDPDDGNPNKGNPSSTNEDASESGFEDESVEPLRGDCERGADVPAPKPQAAGGHQPQ